MKDIVANEGKMKAFLKVGRAVSYPLDLPSILPTVERSEQIVANAKSQIALPDDKVKFAQFWFLKSTPIDDIAFNHLYQGDFDGAIETFKKKQCVSSLQNLVVCYLIKGNNQDALQTAASLYSEYLDDFVKSIDPQASATKQILIKQFVDGLIASGVDLSSLKTSLTDPDWAGAINTIVSKPLVDNLKKALETARASRGNGSNARLNAGKKLMAVVKTDLPKLKGVLDSLQYQVLADKLANEILQCGIDYFNDSDDDDAPHKALPIQKYALKIAVGSVMKDRCQENVDILQKIIDSIPPKEVMAETTAIRKELEKFCKLPDKIEHSLKLLNATKPKLQAIKNKLGYTNAFYLKMSTQVVGNALHNVIEQVNASMSALEKKSGSYLSSSDSEVDKLIKLSNLKITIIEAWKATKIMDTFDIEPAFKSRYTTNRNTLISLCYQLDIPTSSYTSSSKAYSSRSTNSRSSRSSKRDRYGMIAFWITTIVCAFVGALIEGKGFDFGGFFAGGVVGAIIPGTILRTIIADD